MLRLKIILAAFVAGLSGQAIAQTYPVDNYGNSGGYGSTTTHTAFQGFYAGASVGMGFGDAGPNNTQGFLGGLQAGFNFQADKVVFGVEADVMLTGIDAKSYTYTFNQRWLGSGRLRLGYQWNSMLIYGTGGFAGSTMNFNAMGLSQSTNLGGWVLGAGAEMFVTQNISLRGEYLYYSLGRPEFSTPVGPILATTNTNILRLGANYKF
jgi:outer membrane immunogenic protein